MFIPSQGFFSFSCPASKKAGGAPEVGTGHSQGSWPKLAKGVFHTMWCHAQYINWEEWGWGDRCSGTNWASISGWWAIALHIVCAFQSFYYCCCHFISVTIIIISFFFSVLLNCSYPMSFTFLSFFFRFPAPSQWVGGKWVSGCMVLSCWLGLNHDICASWLSIWFLPLKMDRAPN